MKQTQLKTPPHIKIALDAMRDAMKRNVIKLPGKKPKRVDMD